MNIKISLARNEHLSTLRMIELESFETLRSVGAVTGPPAAGSIEDFNQLCQEGLLFVALASEDIPVGFAGALLFDNWLHISEVDVHPNWQRRGIGRRLINTLLSEGLFRGYSGATLTTDRYVPFNASFYASMGFKIVEREDCQRWLNDILNNEISAGLDPERRVAMQLHY
ncbi:GNAT family N-acetyltransferase [Enterobacter asburiae]|uniref:GNAT family N-acetyltransferase n=1 Tax=Enterobacter TaxID=547 RepID=UPI0020762641|nr:GNAT family N-acetyltransferase [Enterobacter bugandensis]MCM7470877.1 GNAT family N-acetyltransferase [Enterobacter bugandensis]